MARIKYSPLVSDISGSIGSATFQKSLYGNTLRSRPRNTKTGSAAQLKARTYMQQCQNAWRSLDPVVRRQWDQFIAFSGQSINRDRGILTTGHALFLKWNYARLQYSMNINTSLVYKSAPAWPGLNSVEVWGNNMWASFTDNAETLEIRGTLFLSVTRNASMSFTKESLRFIPPLWVASQWVYFETAYYLIFGKNPVAGDLLHFKLQFFSIYAPILSAIQTGSIAVTAH